MFLRSALYSGTQSRSEAGAHSALAALAQVYERLGDYNNALSCYLRITEWSLSQLAKAADGLGDKSGVDMWRQRG